MNPVVLEGPNPRPKNEGGLLGRKISAQMRRTKVAAAMQAATIKTRRFEMLCVCCSGFPMISLTSMLPSIEEKPAATAAGWANGCAFGFGAWVLVAEFGPGFGGLFFCPTRAPRVTSLIPSFTSIVAAFEECIVSC